MMSLVRRASLAIVVTVLVGCSPNSSCAKPCKSGLTILLDRVSGALARGTSVDVSVCVDKTCVDQTVTREAASQSAFLAVGGLGGTGDHTITVTSKSASVNGTYNGPITVTDNRPGGAKCTTVCKVGVIRVESNGTPVPGVPSSPTTTAAAATTSAGG